MNHHCNKTSPYFRDCRCSGYSEDYQIKNKHLLEIDIDI